VGVMPLLLFFDYRMVGVGVKIRRRLWLWSVSLVLLVACLVLVARIFCLSHPTGRSIQIGHKSLIGGAGGEASRHNLSQPCGSKSAFNGMREKAIRTARHFLVLSRRTASIVAPHLSQSARGK
jgi:hypothetical protein